MSDIVFKAVILTGDIVQHGIQKGVIRVDGFLMSMPNFVVMNEGYIIDGVQYYGKYKPTTDSTDGRKA